MSVVQQAASEPSLLSFYLIKIQSLEDTITKLKKENKKLSEKVLDGRKEKEDLRILVKSNSSLKAEITRLKEDNEKIKKEGTKNFDQKDEEISRLKQQIQNLEARILINKSNYEKNNDIYSAKMYTLNYLQQDNEEFRQLIEIMKKETQDFKEHLIFIN